MKGEVSKDMRGFLNSVDSKYEHFLLDVDEEIE